MQEEEEEEHVCWRLDQPGAGATRATTLLGLYVRMVFPSEVTLIVDAVVRRFGAEGASIEELATYLGLPEAVVESALNRLPKDIGELRLRRRMRCATTQGNDDDEDDADGDGPAQESRTFQINYRTALPYIAAHFRRLLPELCLTAMPPPTPKDRRDAGHRATEEVTKYSMSEALQCAGCSLWLAPKDLEKFRFCKECNADVVASCIATAATAWIEAPPAGAGSGFACRRVTQQGRRVPTALRREKCLTQQLLLVMYLLETPFVMVDDGGSAAVAVTDPTDVMTPDEYSWRRSHSSNSDAFVELASQFRAKHGSGSHLKVRVQSLAHRERDMKSVNEARLTRRRSIPPWLHVEALQQNGEGDVDAATAGGISARKRPRLDAALQAANRDHRGDSVQDTKKSVPMVDYAKMVRCQRDDAAFTVVVERLRIGGEDPSP